MFALIVVFLLWMGFAKLMAMGVNWLVHRLAKMIILSDKGVNLALIAAYPLILIGGLHASESDVLVNPSHIGPLWCLIVPGAVGFVFLIRSTIEYWRYGPPPCEISVESKLVDLRNDGDGSWRQTFIQPVGRMRRVALLPKNEQFTIDVSTRTYCLPRLPAAWNGLSIVHLTDFHFASGVARRYFEVVCEQAASLQPDLFVFTGDLLDDQQRTEWLPETLGRLKAPLGQYFVLGNHDWYQDPSATRQEFNRIGWIDLASRFVVVAPREQSTAIPLVNGPTKGSDPFVGQCPPLVLCGDETPWMGTHANLTDAPVDACRILLSHTPDNIDWARANRMDLMLAGHTHGGQIRLPILGQVYSPSRYGCRFSSGVFWLDPTLMYVSRGISGKEPIRYNCPPEVTKLVLMQPSAELGARNSER